MKVTGVYFTRKNSKQAHANHLDNLKKKQNKIRTKLGDFENK